MVNPGVSLCFSCGQEVGDPPRLNRLESGAFCEACHDRVLDALPALLPGRVEEGDFAEESLAFDGEEPRSQEEEAIDAIEAALIDAPEHARESETPEEPGEHADDSGSRAS